LFLAIFGENPAEQNVNMAEEGVIDLMDFNMDPEEEERIRNSLQEKTKYKEVNNRIYIDKGIFICIMYILMITLKRDRKLNCRGDNQ